MGFIVIIPFAALSVWSIFALQRWLRRGDFDRSWWRAFGGLAAAGLVVGIYFAFFIQYPVPKTRIESFPIPSGMLEQREDGQWHETRFPVAVRVAALATDAAAGVALCLAPIAVAAFFKENRGARDERGRPRI